jgi:hypothetical protein
VKGRVYPNAGLFQYGSFVPVVRIEWVVIPKPVVMGIYSSDPRLDDRVAACQARKFGHKDLSSVQRDTDPRCIENGVSFRVTDDL